MAQFFKYFVLLGNMRTGSNLFEQNIQLFDSFSSHGELFNPHFIGFLNRDEAFGVTMQEREIKPQKLLNRMISKEKDTLPGFRLFSDHDPRILQHCLNDPECAKIILTRNPLDSFVSHAIAKATDQWKLTDVSKRKKAKVHFDFLEFKAYLTRLENYLSEIKTTLQKTGQTAFPLAFDELNDLEVYNGLAQFLGSEEKLKQLGDKIIRQNPEGLRDKVENFDEMTEQVRMLDLLGSDLIPTTEQVRNPGSKNFVAASNPPLLFMAMHKGDCDPVVTWMKAHQENGGLSKGMNQKQLNEWLSDHPVRTSFTVLRHPLDRAYNAFYKHIFTSGDDLFPWIRTTLENTYGMELPSKGMTEKPNRTVLENSGYGVKEHQKAFLGFLQFLKGNLQGQTRARVDQSWASQNSILQGYCRLAFPDTIVRFENLAEDLQRIESSMGLGHVPLAPEKTDQCFTLSDIYDPEMDAISRDVYGRDYVKYGFDSWG
ncbi:sulfotransferase family 2 domain-containing protein [Amylibacter sp. IMCC11727]|uniref:sulfotransferase family 2 domain-containing protein n=1 Tax=Amylibacter sp. IMCC11727 TaxID=3039851 RepID=UPI00244E20CE|nr:sulfotransferase family 2 domain-containing protein [Amylibacter sp. IMCC11727]WGI22079.1 sulfotransferase family 2 domain-containing protein [Amylibacter sp. IMCC11727]